MRRLCPTAALDLRDEDLDHIELRAATLLDEIGLAVPLSAALRRLAGHPQARLSDERVHWRRDYILELLQAQRRPLPPADHRLHLSAGGGALSILDHRTSLLRPPSTEDLLLTLRICDRLALGGDPPLVPADIPMPLCEVALYRLAWEPTSRPVKPRVFS
ncbi:MAG: hypothetical protein QME94_15830, partial [Anaerolineae bacterium]|nr:hypothetical protein [Anaerolineae bacterium]